MKYMTLGTKPDTFYTEEATRSVLSDVPSDLIIQINNTRFLLHKFPLLLKCGLLQRLCSDTDDPAGTTPVVLHDIPGGEEAFELCAKYCYGIKINLSAHNFVPAFCAARFLRMTESIAKGNFVVKLESFFDTCILQGWKDPIAVLHATGNPSLRSENHRIVQPCMDSIVEKILTHPSKVTWSYTYTRPGYTKKQHRSVPKDWWTEDVSDLELDLFRSIISTVRSTRMLPPPLIGEALHVYACKHLPDPLEARSAESSIARTDGTLTKHRRVLESVVSMIPTELRSVSGRFLLRLLKVANRVGASPSTKAELVRRSGRQLDEATASDLLFPSHSDTGSYDVDVVEAILENFLVQFRRPTAGEGGEGVIGSMMRVAMLIDSYLQVIARDADIPVSKFIGLAESLPESARQGHDELYQAIDTYLKEHPNLSKAERKRLCRILDCRKLSADARSHAIANDRLPLRTIVQLLFIEQERAVGAGNARGSTPINHASLEASNIRVMHDERRTVRQRPEERGQREREEPSIVKADNAVPGRMGRSDSEKVEKKKERKTMEKGEGSGSKV